MKLRPSIVVLTTAVLATARCALALDQAALNSEFSLPDRQRNLVDSQDEYYNAVQQLQDDDAAVVRAREAAVKEAQCTPEYIAAVKAVDSAYQKFNEKKNALVADLQKSNPVYSQMKSQSAAIDARIEAARQNPQSTPEQFEELYKNRDTFQKQWRQLESDAMDRAGITPLRQQWVDACNKLAELQDKQRAAIESNDRLKTALAAMEDQKKVVEQARLAIDNSNNHNPADAQAGDTEPPGAGDLLRRYSRMGITGNDAWWTYGWSTISSNAKPAVLPAQK
jgi:chromosome segregation ATPase